MNPNDPWFCVVETKRELPHPGEIIPVAEYVDLNQARCRAGELRLEYPDKQFAIFNKRIGFNETGLVEDEAGKPPRRR